MVLNPSLENHIVPTYELVYIFLQSDKDITACAMRYPALFCDGRMPHNITMLIENGVTDSTIARMLRTQSRTLNANSLWYSIGSQTNCKQTHLFLEAKNKTSIQTHL
jgi:hypothetical protein